MKTINQSRVEGQAESGGRRKKSKKKVDISKESQSKDEDAVAKKRQKFKEKRKIRHSKSKISRKDLLQKPVLVETETGEEVECTASFEDFDLDERLLKIIGEMGWEKPTLIQKNMIPLVLENKNITARARTGSGKTAAFVLPVLQKVIQLKSSSRALNGPFAVFIAPTKELSSQIFVFLSKFTASFPFLSSLNLYDLNLEDEANWLNEYPDFLVSTPGRLLRVAVKVPNFCMNIRSVVLDEADLLLSYGYAEDLKKLKNFLPTCHQTIFTSATMDEDVAPLKKLLVNGPIVVLKLKESQLPDVTQLNQYHITCQNDEEKFAILLSMFKLNLIIGKSIIFVANTDRCYQLGLFLQGFKIRSCILNAEMPTSSRCNIIERFNSGRYEIIIASDIHYEIFEDSAVKKEESDDEIIQAENSKKKRRKNMDKESGVARGIDFHHISNVINFDFPKSVETYIHRVGRTARGWNKGTALSFATRQELVYLENTQQEISRQLGCEAIQPYEIRIKELESFVLRSRDVLAACTRSVIKEARLAEIKAELLRAKRLETYFIQNPREKEALEHDKKLHSLSLHSPGIADVPDYIVPKAIRNYVMKSKVQNKKPKGVHKRKRLTLAQKKHRRKAADPLQSFTA